MSKSSIKLTVDSGPKQGETLDRKPGSVLRIGRVVRGNTLAIKDLAISQKHLTIEFDPQASRWVLTDSGTSNGTFLNGDRVAPLAAVPLSDGDTVKIGECTSISVKIVVVEERNGGRRGRHRSKRADEVGDRNCGRGLAEHESLDAVIEEGGEEGVVISSKDEILGTDLGDGTEAKNLRRGGRRISGQRQLEEDVSGRSGLEVSENSRRSNKLDNPEDNKDQKCEKKSVGEDALVPVSENGANLELRNLGKGLKRYSTRGSKKHETLELAVCDETEAVGDLRRAEKKSSSGPSDENGITEEVAVDKVTVTEKLGRGRKGKSVKVSKTEGIFEDNSLLKHLDGDKKSSAAQISEKHLGVDLVVGDVAKEPENLGEPTNSVADLVNSESAGQEYGVSVEVPKNLRRGRKATSVSIPKKNEAQEDKIEVPKTKVGRRMTRSTKLLEENAVSELIVEDKIVAPKNAGRRSRCSSSMVPSDDTLDSALEDKIEVQKNLGRGKRNANTSKVPNMDEMVDVVADNAAEVVKNVGRGRPRRAPARNTRASSRVSALQPSQSNLESFILNPVQNSYQSKELKAGCRQLGKSQNAEIIQHISSSPADLKDKRSQIMEDKENDVVTEMCKPFHVLPKTWNGNGIPNTTTKYKEDSKVSFHATPFEQRLERALSDDKLLPKRNLTN